MHTRAVKLSPLAANPPSQLNVLGHDGHALGMDGAQVSVLEQTNKVCLCSLLESKDSMALETKISLHNKERSIKDSRSNTCCTAQFQIK